MHDYRKIANDALQLSDVPPSDADLDAIWLFALTFTGYEILGSFEACAEVANERRGDTLTNLRACLFFEQRRWRHFGHAPDPETMIYIRGIITQIRERIGSGDRR